MLTTLAALLLTVAPPTIVARQTFYTDEREVEILIDAAGAKSVHVNLSLEGKNIAEEDVTGGGIARALFPLSAFPMGKSQADFAVSFDGQPPVNAKVEVVHLPFKSNEVKVDRLTGAFLTDGLPLFPVGFYCYSPVQPTLPEEEFVRGFSMISPYQDIPHTALGDRRKYMDRCAELGMKVNYSLVSLSGGGNGKNLSEADQAKRKMLVDEVKAFKDHPALLSWYLSDEPDGENVSHVSLEEQYQLVKQLDPYHPITIVFCNPPKAPMFKDALDVAMADPYPVPNSDPVEAGDTIAGLRKAFGWEKPLWVVPQAFGGNEWWSREPTRQEMRLMTWQSILNGATGVQSFVRHGLGAFPKSPSMWAESGLMAEEIFELTPFLQSADMTLAPTCDAPMIQARCWHVHGQSLLVLLNKDKKPTAVNVKLDTKAIEAKLPFENRSVFLKSGVLSDLVDGYGTRFYILEDGVGWKKESANPMIDPSFEENPTVGIPSGCYFNLGSDRGATGRVDPRVAHTGNHSVRLIAPRDGGGLTLAFYPVNLTPGKGYKFAVWAKAAKGSNPKIELGGEGTGVKPRSFTLSNEWVRYEFPFTLPAGKDELRISGQIRLATKGIAWIDDVSMTPNP